VERVRVVAEACGQLVHRRFNRKGVDRRAHAAPEAQRNGGILAHPPQHTKAERIQQGNGRFGTLAVACRQQRGATLAQRPWRDIAITLHGDVASGHLTGTCVDQRRGAVRVVREVFLMRPHPLDRAADGHHQTKKACVLL